MSKFVEVSLETQDVFNRVLEATSILNGLILNCWLIIVKMSCILLKT